MASTPNQINSGGGAVDGTQQVVAYLRVSTDKQAEEGLGLDIQEDAIRAFLKKHSNLKLVQIYRDEGISGSTLDRPALRELLTDAKERRAFTRVIVAKLDRLARKLEIQLFIEKELMVYGVEVISVSESFNGTDPIMVAMRQMCGVFAQLERGRITERLLSGRRMKLEGGGYAGGRPPTGYIAKNHELVIDPEGAKIIRRIRKLRMARLSFARIAAHLNAEGIKTRNGARWYASGIHRLLRNPVLKGKVVYGATRQGIHPAIR